MNKCPHCNKALPEATTYCWNCGKKVDEIFQDTTISEKELSNTNRETKKTAPQKTQTKIEPQKIVLHRSESRLAKIIRICARIVLVISLFVHFTIFSNINPKYLFSFPNILYIISLALSLVGVWLINAMAEPFEHLRDCADSLNNIEIMMASQMEETGKYIIENKMN